MAIKIAGNELAVSLHNSLYFQILLAVVLQGHCRVGQAQNAEFPDA